MISVCLLNICVILRTGIFSKLSFNYFSSVRNITVVVADFMHDFEFAI